MVPPIRAAEVRPGATATCKLTIKNESRNVFDCDMSAQDMVLDVNGRPGPGPPGYARGCGRWITFTPARFPLRAGQSANVKCTIRAPRGTQGGYYAKAVCTGRPTPSSASGSGGAITFHYQLGCAVLVTVRSGRLYSRIGVKALEFSPSEGNRSERAGSWTARVTVTNSGNTHTTVEGEARIANTLGHQMAAAPLHTGRGYVLPGGERQFETSGPERLPDGAYVLTARLRPLAKGAPPVSASSAFTLLKGEVHSGQPTPEMRAALAALSPGFYVQQPEVKLSLAPGGRRRQTVTVLNLSDQPLSLVASPRDWEMDEHGQERFPQSAPSHRQSCVTWLSVSPESISIPARGRARLALAVTSPRDAEGDHYAVIVFHKPGGAHIGSLASLTGQVTMVAVRVSGQVKPAIALGPIATTELRPQMTKLRLKVTNTADVECRVNGTVTLLDSLRRTVADNLPFGGDRARILPHSARGFDLQWRGALAPGRHIAVVSAVFDPDLPAAAGELPLDVPARR
jgi:hypothetical protein